MTAANIRKFAVGASHLDDLVCLGGLRAQAAKILDAAIVCDLNVLVSGATQDPPKPTVHLTIASHLQPYEPSTAMDAFGPRKESETLRRPTRRIDAELSACVTGRHDCAF